ncbi:MAG: MBOAT family protein, partial [Bacteroidota bacterium]
MLFHSLTFLGFFVMVLGLYWLLFHQRIRAQNVLLLFASYVFYGWWDWRFLGLIILSSAVDYRVGIALDRAEGAARKRWLWLSVLVNLGVLGFFKYYNFFIDSWVEAWAWLGIEFHLSTLLIILPVGISFYTLQTLTYTIDRYRNQVETVRDPIAFFAFVAFFPQLVAGPIERASNLLPQFFQARTLTLAQAHQGLRWILWGLFTKIVVADSLAPYVDAAYAEPASYGGLTYIWATVLFAFQIYGDFAGYSL